MAATYTGNPSTNDIDRLRFMVGDMDVTQPLMQDAEYQYIIDMYPDNQSKQVATAFRQAATCIGIKATKRSLGPQSEDNSVRLNYYATMADKFEKIALYTAVPPLPDYASEKVFEKDMMANET